MPEITLTIAGRKPKAIRTDRVLVAGEVRVGLLVGYPSGWHLHPLPTDHPMTVNGDAVTAVTRLRVGDVIAGIASQPATVSACTPVPDLAAKLVAPLCDVTAGAGDEAARAEVCGAASPFLIGSADECDLRLTATGVHRHHALLAYADAVWHVHDLTGDGVDRLTGRPAPSVVVVSGETVWLGPVELTVRCRPLDRVGTAAPLAAAVAPPLAPPPAASPTQTAAVAETVTYRPSLTGPLYRRGWDLCRWIQREMAAGYFETTRRGPAPTGGGWFPPADPTAALGYYQDQLAKSPGDAALLFAVADRLAALGFADLERLVLKEMLRYHEADFDLLVRVAERMLADGGRADRAAADRRKDLERADRYAGRAVAVRPDAWEVAELRRQVAVELALLGLPALATAGRAP